MTVFMVERELKGISQQDLGQAQKAAIQTAAQMRQDGSDISYVRSVFTPADGRCMCLFDANSEEQVRRLNDVAGLPYTRVVEAMDLRP